MNFSYLTFSDSAKYALIAKNILEGNGFVTNFSFWGHNLFSTGGIPILYPYLISIFLKLFGTSDFSVIITSFLFYILLLIVVFYTTKKIFNSFVGIMASISVLTNLNFIYYTTSGASEVLFSFEIVLALFLVSQKKIWSDCLGIIVLIAMYFTRPQAFIFIAGLFLFWLILKFGVKRAFVMLFGLSIFGIFVDRFVIFPLSFKYPLTPVVWRGLESILTYSSNSAVSDALRGGEGSTLGIQEIFKKIFYNLYNFYKALPDIMNPYLFGLFIIGLFNRSKNKLQNSFKISVLFLTLLTFFVTALSIPFYRYIHPVVPLIYIVAVGTMVNIVSQFASDGLRVSKEKFTALASTFLILFFAAGQTLGVIFLDSRFERKMKNTDKAPIYVEMSYKLKEITDKDMVIVTNLDTWGSWYGERKTIWFPLEPNMILPVQGSIDAIYLTSYKMDDENYYMGEKWREIFNNPVKQTILPDYEFVGVYQFNADDNYEKESGRSVLLKRKK